MGFNRIVFEYPGDWMSPGFDPLAAQHAACFETIKAAAHELNLGFSEKTCLRMADFAPRFAEEGALLLSVHTIGLEKNVARLKESYLPGYYYFDRTGYSGWAELAFNKRLQAEALSYESEDRRSFIEIIKDEKITNDTSKYEQQYEAENYEFSRIKPYVFLAMQTSDDIVARLSNVDQIRLALLLAEKTKSLGINLVVKRHPCCKDVNIEYLLRRLTKEFSNVHVSRCSVNALISQAKSVVTVNSGVGFEALLLGVPVFTAGLSDYAFVTMAITKGEDLGEIDFLGPPVDADRINRFLDYYLREYCLCIGDIDRAKKLIMMWQNESYSSMNDIVEYKIQIQNYVCEYVAELENLRRINLLHCKNNTFNAGGSAKKNENLRNYIERAKLFLEKYLQL